MGKDSILLVEDNESIMFNMKLSLEFNNYDVLIAYDGHEALKLLQNAKKKPDLIISDIIMPKLDGYQFFDIVSKNLEWNTIPFIFLSAKASPEDIKLGKLLGVDDYLTKPVDMDLLLGIIKKRIEKVRILESELKSKLEIEITNEISKILDSKYQNFKKESIILFVAQRDETGKPKIIRKFSHEGLIGINLDPIGIQLFQTTISLFGNEGSVSTEAVLLNVRSIQMRALVLFDTINDELNRDNQNQIMITVLSPDISYLDSLRVKNVLFNFANDFKLDQFGDFTSYYTEIQSILVH